MLNRNGIGTLAVIVLVLIFLFIGYRAQTFHYCASIGGRPEARLVNGSEPCGPDEEPLEWRRLGMPGRIKLAVRTAAKAFRPN